MTCELAMSSIWTRLREDDPLPADLERHVRGCRRCQREWLGRLRLGRSLRNHRCRLEEALPTTVDGRLTDALAELSKEPRTPRPRMFAPGLSPMPAQRPDAPSGWSRAGWVAVFCAVLWTSSTLSFVAGRSSSWPTAPETATPPWERRLPAHQVHLSPSALQALGNGNTYLLIGPPDGPYQVVDVTHWEGIDHFVDPGNVPAGRDTVQPAELVLAVGPAGGWSRGKQLGVTDLTELGGEILARRALPPTR